MAATANEVSTNGLVDTKQSRPARRRDWPEELKRQMVAETLEAGSSVSLVARRHDLNANQLFTWRWGILQKEPPSVTESGAMVPVEIVPEPETRTTRRRVERAVPVRQTAGTRPLHMAAHRAGRDGADAGAAVDAVGRD